MRWFSHVRFWFWDSQRYTAAQVEELRALQRLSNTHLSPLFDENFFNMFVMRTEGRQHYVDRRVTDFEQSIVRLKIPTDGAIAPIYACYFLYSADVIFDAFKRYNEHRQNRWYGVGHSNDPTRLLILQLQQIANWLVVAPPDTVTLAKVNALLDYLAALQNERVFTQEPDNHGSMDTLLENLRSALRQVQERTQYKTENPLGLPVQQPISDEQKLRDAKFSPMPFKQSQPVNDLYGSLLAFNPLDLYRSQRRAYALCLETPRTVPGLSFSSRGLHHRSVYLQNPERLFKIAEDFLWFKGKDGITDYDRLRSPEGQTLLADLRSRLAAEIAETEQLSADLWWPFHRSSLKFFSYWKESFEWALMVLNNIERNSQTIVSEADPALTVHSYEFINAFTPTRPRGPTSTEVLADAEARLLSSTRLLAETRVQAAAFNARHEQLLRERQEEIRATGRESKELKANLAASESEDSEEQYYSSFEMKH